MIEDGGKQDWDKKLLWVIHTWLIETLAVYFDVMFDILANHH